MSETSSKYGVNDFKDGRIAPERVLAIVREIDPYNKTKYTRRDEITLGRLFSDVFRDVARYNTTAREWYVYDGIVWKCDTESMIVEQYAKMLQGALMVYSTGLQNESNQDDVVRYQKFIASLGARGKRMTMINDARSLNFVSADDFDRDPYLFNCQNCVIDLRTLKRLDHDPALLLSMVSNVYYDKDAHPQLFLKFLDEVMKGNVDVINYLQMIFGYALTGENTQEQFYLCYGSTTRNGKSTLLDVIGYMFGTYGKNIQPETLAQKDKNSRSASGDIARLNGCRFLQMSEPPKRMKFDVALLKTLLGRDRITARHIYEREFEFVPVFKLFINSNYLPIVADDTLFSSGRVKVIPFDRHFEPEEQDRTLKRRLKARENISGLFNWCLEGLRRYYQSEERLIEPEAVLIATGNYRKQSDKIQNFINDCLDENVGKCTSVKDCYEVYGQWCRESGFGVENKSNFIDELKTKGLYATSGTVGGRTVRNVVRDYTLSYEYA